MFRYSRTTFASINCKIKALRSCHTESLTSLHRDFKIWQDFLSHDEQRLLLRASLDLLDAQESKRFRQRRKQALITSRPSDGRQLDDLFYPDPLYDFQEGHFDEVIRNYREMHLASWPEDDIPSLTQTLRRLSELFPTAEPVQTHLLHLASEGEILPHVDNIEASGSWILAVSLGAQRNLTIQRKDDGGDSFSIPLPSGSIYMQRDSLRYQYTHAIEKGPERSQRLSIMIRVRQPISNSQRHSGEN